MSTETQLSPDLYAALGWPVFACRPGSKEPATRHGFKDASTDVDEVAAMFRGREDLNVATATGYRFDVLDFDVKPERDGHPAVDSRPWVHKLNAAGLLAGALGIAETRNGGLHLFFPTSGQPSGSLAAEGIDFKALGGYVILPPSRVPSDFPDLPGEYRWIEFPGDIGRPLDWQRVRAFVRPALTPNAAPTRLTARTYTSASGLLRVVEQAGQGERNHRLFWAACRAVEEGVLDDLREDLIFRAVGTGLPHNEVVRTIRSAEATAGGGRHGAEPV